MFLPLTSCKTQVSQPFPAPSNNFSIFSLFWRALLHLFRGNLSKYITKYLCPAQDVHSVQLSLNFHFYYFYYFPST